MSAEKKDGSVENIISNAIGFAGDAADGVTNAFHSVASVAGEKYELAKLKFELYSLRENQGKYFESIGRLLFSARTVETNKQNSANQKAENIVDTQKAIDFLLVKAEQTQQEIDLIVSKISRISGEKGCSSCGKMCNPKSVYCSNCGKPLPKDKK